jgi:hypothetical protein
MPVQSLLPEMLRPPVTEVVCGAFFSPLGLDALTLGAYWARRRGDYPGRRVLPAISEDEAAFIINDVAPIRAWMISENEEYIVQLQQDRFYVNWRSMKTHSYPRFHDSAGVPGIATILSREFAAFSTFCEQELGEKPTLVSADLSKINMLVQSVHWQDFADLKKLLPIVSTYDAVVQADTPNFNVRILKERDPLDSIHIASGREAEDAKRPLVRIEIRGRRPVNNQDFMATFAQLNDTINETFGRLIPRQEMIVRFGGR